jgi:TatD family-associated radical SAM protein
MEEERKNQPNGNRPRRRRKHGKGHNAQNSVNGQNKNPQAQNQGQNKNPQVQNQGQNKNPQVQNQKDKKPKKQGQKNQGDMERNKRQSQNPPKNQRQEGNKHDTYAYALDGNLYINLTNKCSNGCDFCVRNERSSYFGHELWIRSGDPTPEKVIEQIERLGGVQKYKEVVFCGFGEPTYRMEEMCAVADYVHAKGGKTRLNTNGQGCLINKRDILPELKDKIDLINVSMNAPDAESYQKICRSMFKENGFSAMVEFAKGAKRLGIACRFSVVDCIGEEGIAACKKVAEGVNVPLYVRNYITDS